MDPSKSEQSSPDHQATTDAASSGDLLDSAPSLVRTSTMVYGVMATIGFAIIHYGHRNLEAIFSFTPVLDEPLRLLGSAGLGAGILMISAYFFEDWFESFRQLKTSVTQLLGSCSLATALYLAVISSVAEEMLFRGAIQPFAGLVITSVLFGLLHLGQDGRISAWSFWAVLAGLLLGFLYEATGSLWPPLMAHALVNTVSILNIRRTYRQWTTHDAAQPEEAPEEADEVNGET